MEEFDKILIKKNPSDEIIETVHNLNTDTKVDLNSISLIKSFKLSPDISQLKVLIESHDESIKKITEEDHLDLTKVPPISDHSKIQLEKKFLKELNKIILNQFDRVPPYETFKDNAFTCDLFDLKIRPGSLPEFIPLNQPILN